MYRAIVAGNFLCDARSLSCEVAVTVVREALASRDEGTVGKVERRTPAKGSPRRQDAGPWLIHRAYVVGSDGIVRRTDRSPRPCRKCGWPHVGEACVTA